MFDALTAEMRRRGDPARAAHDAVYMKSTWRHWGVTAPNMDAAIKAATAGAAPADLLALATRLWAEPVWDCRIVAGRILSAPRVPAGDDLWRWIVARLPEMDGWAVEDNLMKAAWKCLRADPRRLDTVETWLGHDSFWVRRAAFVYTLPWSRPGEDPDRMLAWAARLASDREWFVQKAIGWWLRGLGRHDPARVEAFLAAHGAALKPVAVREAVKYLPARR
ncbi:MAG: DNA alkylation repair protein [Hyphomicrobiales bacterium]|nr:DNA alkylation repair protein [Hyphomicrobiales bacterium]MCP5371871.1 DNA alkylation repair protein [Hyphomicrobiales bacterium]